MFSEIFYKRLIEKNFHERKLKPCYNQLWENSLLAKMVATKSHKAILAKWLSVRLRTKWLWVRISLQLLGCFEEVVPGLSDN